MDANRDVDFSIITAGFGTADERDHLSIVGGLFLVRGVQPGDTLFFEDGAGNQHYAAVLQVNSDDVLVYQPLVRPPDPPRPVGPTDLPNVPGAAGPTELPPASPIDIPPGEYMVRVARYIVQPCPICQKNELAREIDHMHCNWCLTEIPLDHATVNCPACIQAMRQRLVKERSIQQKMTMFGGRRQITVHALTVFEGDQAQELQEAFVIGAPGVPRPSQGFVFDEVKKAQLALGLDDDGLGQKPAGLVQGGVISNLNELRVAMKFFKSMTQAQYRGIHTCMAALEALVQEACRYKIDDTLGEEELLGLADDLAHATGPVYGTVALFDGIEHLTFCDPLEELIEEADNWTENFRTLNQNNLLEGRYNFFKSMSRVAAVFRRDGKVAFTEESTHQERLAYLSSLPTPYYYLYLAASNVFARQVAQANRVEVLGNS
jgi:hypothetical protein